MFNQGGGFFTPKNFQFPQHFTPKTLIGHSTTTNESCSLMLDSDVRSVTYALKSSKESTLRQETNSTQGENKNIRMIEYEEFEKSNSSQIQYSQEQNTHHNNLIVDINTGRSGKLIAEGTLSHADSEERNQITPQSQQILQFDFKLKQQQQQQQSVSSSQQLLDSQNFTESQRNNLQSNDFWIQSVKLDTDLQFVNKNIQKIDLRENIQNIQDEDKMLGLKNDDLSSDINVFQNIQQSSSSSMDNIEQINLTQEKPKKRVQSIDLQQQQKEQTIKVTQSGKEKSKIYVQDNNFQESIIYEEEDSENSKSTDRQFYKLNRSISNQILGQINSIPRCQSSARNESQQKNCSNKNLHNTSKNSQASFNQSVQAFNIEEENSESKQQQHHLSSQQNIAKCQENNQQIQDINHLNLTEKQIYHGEQQQNQQAKQNYQQPKEQFKNSFFQVNKQHLCINNIDTNFQNVDFNQKPFSSFQQNNEVIYEFFGASKKDNLKDCQDAYQCQVNTSTDEMLLNENKIQNNNICSDLVQTAQENMEQNQSEQNEKYKNEANSDQLFYPNSSKCNQSSLDECYNYQQDTENKENSNNGPIQKLNFDQCQSSEGSQSSREDDLNNDSIVLKQNFQNLITNYKKRNSSFPQLSNSHNTSKNSNFNSNSNPQIEVTPSINNMRGTFASNLNKINGNKTLQDNLEEQDSQQQPFRSGQCSVILKKLEETLDMNSESDFYLIKKLQLSHGVSQQHSEIDTSQNLIQPQMNLQQYKRTNPITNQTYILEETGEDFIFNSKEIERLEQIDNSFFANNKENMGAQNSSINFDSKVLLADTIYSSCNTSHLYFINQSSEKRGFKSHQKERKSHFINMHENSYNQQIQSGTSQLNKIKKNQQYENQIQSSVLQRPQQQQTNNISQDEQKSQSPQLNQSQQNRINQIQMQNKISLTKTNENINNQEINYIQEIENLKREVIKLNKDLKNIDIQNYKYQEIIDQQQANILRLEEKLIYYKDEVKSKQQQIENKDMQINKLFEEKEELKQKKKKLKEQIKAKNQEIYQQQKVNYTVKNEAIHKLQQQIDQKNGILNERNEQFQAIQQQICDTSSQLEAKQQEINSLIQENQQLKEQMKFYSQDQANTYLQTSNKNYTNQTGQINQKNNKINKLANSEYNNKQIINNESNLQPNYITTSSSSSSTQCVQSGYNCKDQKFSNTQNQNDKRIRSFSQNDTCSNQNSNQSYGQKIALNLDQMISSQPYNLTEESQQLTKSTQQDIANSQENFCQQVYNNHRTSFQGNQLIGVDQNMNRFQNSLQGNLDKLKHQQVRYSYDNYKVYQSNQQKPINLPQPMTLNSAIAQYKIQALEDRKYTEANNNYQNNHILVNQQYNPLEQSFKQIKSQKQIENSTNSNSSVGYNCNESISQFGNRSQISTSCNSRHYESHVSNSQMASNNNSQKSLISVNQKNQQNQQQQKQQIYQQNNSYERNDTLHQNNVRSRTSDHNSKDPQYCCFNEKGRDSSSQNIKEIYAQNLRSQSNQPEKENLMHKFENTQYKNLNKNCSTQQQQEKNVLHLQNNNSLNSFNQNQIKINFLIGERVSTSPSRNQKGNQIINNELNEYNSVPSYINNESDYENKQLLGEQNYYNQLNGKKQIQSNIDVASINNKINSNNKLIQNLNLSKNKQSSLQGGASSIIQNNLLNNNQNLQQKIKREHSYSLNQQFPITNNIDQNSQQNPQLSSSFIDQNKFKKPPRSTNEMRQSFQGSSQQQLLISTQQININNHNENIYFANIENRNSQKQVAFAAQTNYINEFSKQNHNEPQIMQHKQYYQQQQQQHQSSQRLEKFQKWNNQINSLI